MGLWTYGRNTQNNYRELEDLKSSGDFIGNDIIRFYQKSLSKRKTTISTEPTRVLLLGDSTTAGLGSSGEGIMSDGARNTSPPKWLGDLFNTSDLKSCAQSIYGDQRLDDDFFSWDDRFSTTEGWEIAIYGDTYSGWFTNSTTDNALTFQSKEPVDTFRVWYAQFYSEDSGGFDIQYNNDSPIFVSTFENTNELKYIDITGIEGLSTLKINRNGGATLIAGIECWSSTSTDVNIIQMGGAGRRIQESTYTTYPWASRNAILALDADLVVVNLVINEWFDRGEISAFKSDIEDLIRDVVSSGSSICFTTGNPTDYSVVEESVQLLYVNAVKDVCKDQSVVLIDTYNAIGNRLENSDIYYDGSHPNKAGYDLLMRSVYHKIKY